MLGSLYVAALGLAAAGLCLTSGSARAGGSAAKDGDASPPFYGFAVKDIAGQDVDLAKYNGQVCLVVNVASK